MIQLQNKEIELVNNNLMKKKRLRAVIEENLQKK